MMKSVHIFGIVAVLVSQTSYGFTPNQVKPYYGRTVTSPDVTSFSPSIQNNKRTSSSSADGSTVVVKMPAMRSANSKLPNKISSRVGSLSSRSKTRFQSSIALDFPRERSSFPNFPSVADAFRRRTSKKKVATVTKANAKSSSKGITKMDAALFATYFCNMMVVNLSVVTVPAFAAEQFVHNPQAIGAFVAGVASMAPLGGAVGKLVNGFVCQRLGPNRSSYMYLMGLSLLSIGMSSCKSLAPVGLMLVGFEFLSSIQWVSLSSVLHQHYSGKPELMAKGISILSLSSTCGALAAKTVGAGLLQASGDWRTVTKIGALIALFGSFAMKIGIQKKPSAAASSIDTAQDQSSKTQVAAATRSPMESLKSVLGSKVFWMVGIAHSLGMVAKGSDRFLGSFLQDISGLSASVCAVLTSSVTVGMLFGLIKGKRFASTESLSTKMRMLKGNYRLAMGSTLGLALSGISCMSRVAGAANNIGMAGIVTILSGLLASSVSFQFYQIPNLVSNTSFQEADAPVALSLIDALGFFATAQLFSAFTMLLSKMGWSASWGFLAIIFGFGSTVMTNALKPVLIESKRRAMANAARSAAAATTTTATTVAEATV